MEFSRRPVLGLVLATVSSLFSSCAGVTNSISPGSANSASDPPLLAADKLTNASQPLNTPTYDGSGQATEPSVRVFPKKWHGFTHWMVLAPFPNVSPSKENPSILASNDGLDWVVPRGLINPIALPKFGHFADSELFYDANTNELWVYFGWEFSPKFARIMRTTSSDGVHWNPPQAVFESEHYRWTSPTVQKVGNFYYMWTVDADARGCSTTSTQVDVRTSTDGMIWSHPQATDLSQSGYVIWHTEALWVDAKRQFWMLAAAFREGKACGSTVLFFANSVDGIHWTAYSQPVLTPGSSWDEDQIYRSALDYDPVNDLLRVWYSGQNSRVWHIGYAQADFAQFLQNLQK